MRRWSSIRTPEDEPVGLVDLVRQRIGRVEPSEPDRLGDLGEEPFDHRPTPPMLALGPVRSDEPRLA